MTGKLTHFEIYGEDPEALADFYRSVLGWAVTRIDGVDYWRIEHEGQVGGIARPPSFEQKGWLNFVQIASVDDALAAATAGGGTILKQKSAVPRTAWHAVIRDPVGNTFMVWEPDPHAMPMPEPD